MALSWFTTLYTVVHIIFGTLVFSSVLFMAVEDAVGVVLRLLLSGTFLVV